VFCGGYIIELNRNKLICTIVSGCSCLRKLLQSLGPLYIMAKGCDRDNVRALEMQLKALPWMIGIFVWAFRCSIKT
jgi:hypothetical protein